MKRLMIAALALLLGAFVLVGCAQKTQAGAPDAPDASAASGAPDATGATDAAIHVVTTLFPPYDFTRAIAGDKAEITMLLPPGAESHSFEPTPQDIIAIQDCDVFIYVGGESDEWVDEVLSSLDTSHMRIVTLMDCVELVEEEIVEGMQDEEEGEDAHGEEASDGDAHDDADADAHGEEADTDADAHGEEAEYDEHVWTSPRNAKLIVQKISDALCDIDAANAELYRTNTEAYLAQLDELDAEFRAVVGQAARKTVVFGDRFPFRYFADAYGLDYYAAFPGCSTETEASAATVAFLIDKVGDEGIPVVFHIELSNAKIADTIAEQTGAEVLLFHACHNISQSDFESGKTYLDLMRANVKALEQALN
ncbi:MAG: metal ABC transporter substrate-binding protein [Coriobacteriales bacterium]|jgi:zinc transport system substrate-binding protein|nr:metal ABC transporter substrate-binding protein [Coriobacteriales bacterium]